MYLCSASSLRSIAFLIPRSPNGVQSSTGRRDLGREALMDVSSELLYCRLAVVDDLETASVTNPRWRLGLDDRFEAIG